RSRCRGLIWRGSPVPPQGASTPLSTTRTSTTLPAVNIGWRVTRRLSRAASPATAARSSASDGGRSRSATRTDTGSRHAAGERGLVLPLEQVDELHPLVRPAFPHVDDAQAVPPHQARRMIAKPRVERPLVLLEDLVDPQLVDHSSWGAPDWLPPPPRRLGRPVRAVRRPRLA